MNAKPRTKAKKPTRVVGPTIMTSRASKAHKLPKIGGIETPPMPKDKRSVDKVTYPPGYDRKAGLSVDPVNYGVAGKPKVSYGGGGPPRNVQPTRKPAKRK